MTNKQIALHIGCSPSRLTMLSQRRAGDKIREEGFSTTQILSSRIKGLLNNLDIVVSDDCHSLCSEKAVQSYKIVNDLKKLRTPNFLRYNELKRWFA